MDEKLLYAIVDKAKRYDELLKLSQKEFELSCSFCGKSQSAVNFLVSGPKIYICDECVELCVEIIEDKKQEKESKKSEVETV